MSESTTWSIEPHTLAKHQILRGYLDAWLPITTRYNSRVLYIDGFAGPGRYRDGEDGSPIIALKAALEHHYPMSAEIIYLFIEVDARRSANLRQEIARLSLPPNIQVHVQQGRFDETISDLLDHLGGSAARLAPTFAFIDPFGWTGAPFSIIQRLLARQRCEVLVNLMYEEVNRFLALPRQADNWNRLFGTSGWEHVLGAGDAIERQQRVHDLYEHQMRRNAGARFVRSFEMRNKGNRTDYFLFFATNNLTGLQKMKDAMWRVDRDGSYRFSDASATGQLVLFEPEPDYLQLRRLIQEHFRGQIARVEQVEQFVVEETPFLVSHYKRQVLAPMEREEPPSLAVQTAASKRKRGTFPSGTVLRFL